jgi:thiamine kinase-like enzyme
MERVNYPIELERAKSYESAATLAKELGANVKNIVKLDGGINNEVYRVDTEQRSFVLKRYPEIGTNLRDRMKAEVEFLQYTNKAASSFVPRLIDFDFHKRAVLMEFIEGETFIKGQSLSENQVRDAVCFFETLNKDRETAKKFVSMDAAEGFNKLTDHLNNVEQRISKLTTRHLPIDSIDKSSRLLKRLTEEYGIVKQITLTSITKGRTSDEIALDKRCISASDFGFHNAIQTESGLKFIDFEFAGWDDPAKASLDFVLQPRVPVYAKPTILIDALNDQLIERDNERMNLLGAILRIKWLCIILSVLDGERFSQLTNNKSSAGSNFFLNERLRDAHSYFDREIPHGLH